MNTTYPSNIIKNTLLVVGTLGSEHGLAAILDALLLLKNTGLRVNLHCVGQVDGAVKDILDTSESYKFIKEQVTFAGFKNFPDSYKNIENCFAGFLLPEEFENRSRNYADKIFEYMAVGLPIICSDFAANREIIDKCNCGICVDISSTEEIADAISYLKQAAYQATKMGECGRKAVAENYNWQTEETQILKSNKKFLS